MIYGRYVPSTRTTGRSGIVIRPNPHPSPLPCWKKCRHTVEKRRAFGATLEDGKVAWRQEEVQKCKGLFDRRVGRSVVIGDGTSQPSASGPLAMSLVLVPVLKALLVASLIRRRLKLLGHWMGHKLFTTRKNFWGHSSTGIERPWLLWWRIILFCI